MYFCNTPVLMHDISPMPSQVQVVLQFGSGVAKDR